MTYDPITKGKPAVCPNCGTNKLKWEKDHFECEECTLGRDAEYKLWSIERWNRFVKECKLRTKLLRKRGSLNQKKRMPVPAAPTLVIDI